MAQNFLRSPCFRAWRTPIRPRNYRLGVILADTVINCDPTPTLARRPFAGFTEWLSGSWNRLLNCLAPPQGITPATETTGSTNYLQPYSGSSNVYSPALSRDGTLNLSWVKETSNPSSDYGGR